MIRPSLNLLRIRQWVKNLLIFVPVLAAHILPNLNAMQNLLFAFFAMSFCASAVYVINDIFDIEADRLHPVKRNRPLAAELIELNYARIIAAALLVFAFSLAVQVNTEFTKWLVGYFSLTLLYTFWLKQIVIFDCFTLASLYTFRILAGAAVMSIEVSFWLLACSGFLFLSLAFAKRYGEIAVNVSQGRNHSLGRGYQNSDAQLILSFGVGSGLIASLVLALYVNSESILEIYRSPIAIWGTVPILLIWIFRIWLKTHRGEIADDPLLYATKDPVSIVSGLIVATLVVMGAEGWIA